MIEGPDQGYEILLLIIYVKIVNYIIIIIQLDIDFSQGWSKFFYIVSM